jgi:hypothetical protein
MIRTDFTRPALRIAALLSAVVLAAILLGACGGSKGTTVAQFKSDVNAECKKVDGDKSAAARAKAINSSSASALQKEQEILQLSQPFFKQLGAISPPPKDTTAEQMHVAFGRIAAAIGVVAAAKSTTSKAVDNAGTAIQTNETVLARDFKSIGASNCT